MWQVTGKEQFRLVTDFSLLNQVDGDGLYSGVDMGGGEGRDEETHVFQPGRAKSSSLWRC
jgi:hypothetical protein